MTTEPGVLSHPQRRARTSKGVVAPPGALRSGEAAEEPSQTKDR